MEHQPDSQCKEVFALLSQYLDVELPQDACEQIEAHVQGCPPCIEFVESLRKTIALCRQYRPNELPAPLAREASEALLAAYRRSVRT